MDEETVAFRPSGASMHGFGAVSVVPGSRFWMIGSQTFPIGLSEASVIFPDASHFTPVAVHPRFDLAAYLRAEGPSRCRRCRRGETDNVSEVVSGVLVHEQGGESDPLGAL